MTATCHDRYQPPIPIKVLLLTSITITTHTRCSINTSNTNDATGHLPPDICEQPPPTKKFKHGSFGLIAADKGRSNCHTTHLNQHQSDRAA